MFLTKIHPPRLEALRSWSKPLETRVNLGADLGELGWVSQNGGIDAQRLPETLTVRRRQGGETLKPAARAKTTNLQHLCQVHGVLPWMRDALPLVFADDHLIAVGDLWLDARWCTGLREPGVAIEWQRAPFIV
jgi:tRNA(Ile)-lysidine synthase